VDNLYLGIETSSTNCSVGLFKNAELVDLFEVNEGYSHGEVLAIIVDDLLKKHNLSLKNIKAIGIGKGPGSYTGLRIGVAFAKGLAFSNSIKLIAIDSLRNMAMQIVQNRSLTLKLGDVLISLVDARRDEVYFQIYNTSGEAINKTEAQVINNSRFQELREYKNVYCFGSGSDKLASLNDLARSFIHITEVFPSVLGMGLLLNSNYLSGKFEDEAYFEPFYLKEFIAGKPKKNNLIP